METLSFPRYNVAEIVTHVRNKILTGADGKNLSKSDLYPNPKVRRDCSQVGGRSENRLNAGSRVWRRACAQYWVQTSRFKPQRCSSCRFKRTSLHVG